MLMEICRIVPKWSPTPVPPPLLPGLNFSGFSGFFGLFCPPTLPRGEFWPETFCDCRLCTMKVWAMSRLCWWRYAIEMEIGRNELGCCLLLACCLLIAAAAAAAKIFSRLWDLKGCCKTNLVNQLGDPNQDFVIGPSWLLILWFCETFYWLFRDFFVFFSRYLFLLLTNPAPWRLLTWNFVCL